MRKKTFRRSFTMIELLAVMAIIAALAGLGAGGYSFAMHKVRVSRTQARIAQISTALETLKQKYGFYPRTMTSGTNSDYRLYVNLNSNAATNGKFLCTEPAGTARISVDYMAEYAALVNLESLQKNSRRFGTDTISVVTDAWGRPLYYRCPGTRNPGSFDLYSAGADGKVGLTELFLWTDDKGEKVTENDKAEKLEAADTVQADDIGNF